jgi:hypothetical protein
VELKDLACLLGYIRRLVFLSLKTFIKKTFGLSEMAVKPQAAVTVSLEELRNGLYEPAKPSERWH